MFYFVETTNVNYLWSADSLLLIAIYALNMSQKLISIFLMSTNFARKKKCCARFILSIKNKHEPPSQFLMSQQQSLCLTCHIKKLDLRKIWQRREMFSFSDLLLWLPSSESFAVKLWCDSWNLSDTLRSFPAASFLRPEFWWCGNWGAE